MVFLLSKINLYKKYKYQIFLIRVYKDQNTSKLLFDKINNKKNKIFLKFCQLSIAFQKNLCYYKFVIRR